MNKKTVEMNKNSIPVVWASSKPGSADVSSATWQNNALNSAYRATKAVPQKKVQSKANINQIIKYKRIYHEYKRTF